LFENPLLPHRKLQELYKLIEHCRTLETKQRTPSSREAILAATTIHLEDGDHLCTAPGDAAVALAPTPKASNAYEGFTPSLPRLLITAALTRGFQLAGSPQITLAYSNANSKEEGWAEAFTWAQTDRLPLVFCIADAPRPRAASSKTALTWPNVDRLCRRLQFPTLTVDGEDAVAVFRTMQEAALRARSGHGPSLIWAMLSPAGTKLTRSQTPTARLKRYLAARKIPIPQ
jgi:hypothetical protein